MLQEKFDIKDTKFQAIVQKMAALKVSEDDIEEKFVRGGGSGGQKINKSTNCVYLKHLPTGIEVKFQKFRERNKNRIFALRELLDKIEYKMLGKNSAIEKKRAKIRKQKQKRKKRSQEKHSHD